MLYLYNPWMTCVIVIENNDQTHQLFLSEQYFCLFCVVNEANQLFFFEQRLTFGFALVDDENINKSPNITYAMEWKDT